MCVCVFWVKVEWGECVWMSTLHTFPVFLSLSLPHFTVRSVSLIFLFFGVFCRVWFLDPNIFASSTSEKKKHAKHLSISWMLLLFSPFFLNFAICFPFGAVFPFPMDALMCLYDDSCSFRIRWIWHWMWALMQPIYTSHFETHYHLQLTFRWVCTKYSPHSIPPACNHISRQVDGEYNAKTDHHPPLTLPIQTEGESCKSCKKYVNDSLIQMYMYDKERKKIGLLHVDTCTLTYMAHSIT